MGSTPKSFTYVASLLLLISLSFAFPGLTRRLERDQTQSAINDTASCDAASFYTSSPRTRISRVMPNVSKFCPNLYTTCCDTLDFKNIQDWWQMDKTQYKSLLHETRIETLKRKQEMVYLYTNELLNLYLQLKDRAKSITKRLSSDLTCKVAARNFLAFTFDIAYFDSYREDLRTCMKHSNSLQETLMCSACDPNSRGFLDLPNTLIRLDPLTCQLTNKNCYNSVKTNLNHIFPYLQVTEPLVRCNLQGKQTQ
jgi:hypothetical protein